MFNTSCCLLCLKNSNDQIELNSKEGQSLNTNEVIGIHFKDELIIMPQIKMRVVCRKCWRLVQTFHEFYLNVQRAHKEAADTLKNLSFVDDDVLEIKEEFEYSEEDKSPPHRRGERPKRQKIEYISDVSCDTNLPLEDCQVISKDLTLPAHTASSAKDICPQQTEDVLPYVSCEANLFLKENQVENEDLIILDTTPPSSNDICLQQNDTVFPTQDIKEEEPVEYMDITRHTGASDTDEMESSEREDNITKRLSGESHHFKGVDRRTAELDEYLAKKNFKFNCCTCGISLENFKTLMIHFRKKHKTRGYVLCCGKKLPHRALLIDHIHFHEDPDYFKCKQCGKRLSERRSLDDHLQYGHGKRERVHRCSICSKGFFRASCLKRHYNTHVTNDKKTVPCSKCDKTFADDVELRKHMRYTHLNASAKLCEICGVSIKRRAAFERHQAEHSGLPRTLIKCDLCDAALTSKCTLARHMKTMHTKEYQTPQVCPICYKVSPSLQAHRYHIKYIHSLERKHACKLCDKAFKRLTAFKEHMATHTGEVLYTCTFCPQTFNSGGNMRTHRKRKHSKEWAELCATKKSLVVPAKEGILMASSSEQQ